MKIALVSQTFDLHTNGQGVFVVRLARGLVQAGHDVLVIRPSERGAPYRERVNGLTAVGVHAVGLAPFYRGVFVTPFPEREVQQLLLSFQPHVVHIHDHYPLCSSAARIAQRCGITLVGTNNFLPDNITLNVALFRAFRGPVNRLLWRMVLRVFNRTDVTVAATPTAAATFRARGFQVPVKAISCGVDLDRFHPNPTVDVLAMRQRYALDPNRIVFLYVGRLEKEKRLDLLLRAFARAADPALQLAIAGRGLQSKALRALAHRLELDDRVVFTGFVPDEDLPALLNSVNYFVMPGDTELQSLATLEAVASGLPVLASSARALPELVRHQRSGYLFRAGHLEDLTLGIHWLAERLVNWRVMSAASLRVAQPHALQNTITQYVDLYRSVFEPQSSKEDEER